MLRVIANLDGFSDCFSFYLQQNPTLPFKRNSDRIF